MNIFCNTSGRMSRLGLIAILSGLALNGAGAGYTSRLQVGNWSGGAWADDKTNEFRNCGAGLKFSGGTEITVIVGSNYVPFLVMIDPRIQVQPQQRLEAATKFDPGGEIKLPVLGLNTNMIQFALPAFPNTYDIVRKATRFSFIVPGVNSAVDVTGIAQVLPRLFECVLAERGKMNLSVSAPPPAAPPDKLDAAMAGLALAEKSGIGPYIVFADKDRPPAYTKTESVWGHPGVPGPDGPANILGATFWYPPVAGDTAAKLRDGRKDSVRQGCADGTLQLVDLPAIANKPGAVGIGLSCRNTYEEIYLVPRKNGGYYEFGLSAPPGKRKTLEAAGARYREAIAALIP